MDWRGDTKSIYVTLGASNHSNKERQPDDYYATDPKALDLLLSEEQFSDRVWECACGEGHLSKVLTQHGYDVTSSDLVYRGYGTGGVDFLECTGIWRGDIITNPPYKYALPFVKKALELISKGNRIAMFLKLQFLEGQERGEFFKTNPPKTVYVARKRLNCAMNGDFHKYPSSAIAYAWFIWVKGYHGDPIIKWFN